MQFHEYWRLKHSLIGPSHCCSKDVRNHTLTTLLEKFWQIKKYQSLKVNRMCGLWQLCLHNVKRDRLWRCIGRRWWRRQKRTQIYLLLRRWILHPSSFKRNKGKEKNSSSRDRRSPDMVLALEQWKYWILTKNSVDMIKVEGKRREQCSSVHDQFRSVCKFISPDTYIHTESSGGARPLTKKTMSFPSFLSRQPALGSS